MQSSESVSEPFSKCRKCTAAACLLPEIPQFPGVRSTSLGLLASANPDVQVEASAASASLEDTDRNKSSSSPGRSLGDGGCDESWRDFTPSTIDPGRCFARTWGKDGRGGQCSRKLKSPGICPQCERRGLTHGRVDGPIPAAKLAAFRKQAILLDAAGRDSRDSAGGK